MRVLAAKSKFNHSPNGASVFSTSQRQQHFTYMFPCSVSAPLENPRCTMTSSAPGVSRRSQLIVGRWDFGSVTRSSISYDSAGVTDAFRTTRYVPPQLPTPWPKTVHDCTRVGPHALLLFSSINEESKAKTDLGSDTDSRLFLPPEAARNFKRQT
jgi:hypothetical protein